MKGTGRVETTRPNVQGLAVPPTLKDKKDRRYPPDLVSGVNEFDQLARGPRKEPFDPIFPRCWRRFNRRHVRVDQPNRASPIRSYRPWLNHASC